MRLGYRPRVGGLFAGYGGLDLAVADVFGGELAWYAEVDGLPTEKKPYLHGACRILAHRFPGVPNIGDVTLADWAILRGTIEILTGGSPCQDLSHAGKRAGMTEGTRSNLWVAMREAIATIRPNIVIWENVRGAFTAEADSDLVADPRLLAEVRRRDGEPVLRAAGRVVGDLSELGYDAGWITIRAADVGGCHGRPRVFVVATDPACDPWWLEHGDSGAAADPGGEARLERPGLREGVEAALGRGRPADGDRSLILPTPRATDGTKGGPNQRGSSGDLMLPSAVMRTLPTPSARDYKDHTIRREPHRPDDVDTLSRALTDVPAATGPLLPTPAVNDMGEGKTPEGWDAWTDEMKARHGNGNGHGKSLAIEAQRLLPTPNTQDAKGAGSAASRDDGRQAQLHDTVKKLLPTPVVTDASDSARHTTSTGVAHPGTSLTDATRLLPTPVATEGRKGDYSESAESRRDAGHAVYIANAVRSVDDRLLPTPGAALADGGQTSRSGDRKGEPLLAGIAAGVVDEPDPEDCEDFDVVEVDDDDDVELALLPTPMPAPAHPTATGDLSGELARWGDYAPAISRWQHILARPAPDPTMTSKKGNPQLAPRFVEWMMGLPDGWVCDVPGVTRNEALRALGNGVCPQQAAAAIRTVLSWSKC